MIESVLAAYGLDATMTTIRAFGTGLINHTWKITTPSQEYILQRVNQEVFKSPEQIAANISLIEEYLRAHHPTYCFVAPVKALNGGELIHIEQGYFRLFPFVAGSHSMDTVETAQQAYEAAAQFGRFTRVLSGLDARQLHITIPHFHDLELRYRQFLLATEKGLAARIAEAADLIRELRSQASIVDDYKNILRDPAFRVRVTHHDTKISNVLFGTNGRGLCVIDLDTVMPGYFISDVGDMMRTYLSPANEEEKDFDRIVIREDFYEAITSGYYHEMEGELSGKERNYFFYAGKFMIYMQALRFLTDHLNNDIYYGAKYAGHNLVRAGNQAVLLRRLLEKEEQFDNLII